MRMILGALMACLIATGASAQGVNLTGRWQCVAACAGPPGSLAYITQNGWELNVLSDTGGNRGRFPGEGGVKDSKM
jgi:hypothetical protein